MFALLFRVEHYPVQNPGMMKYRLYIEIARET